MAPWPPRPIRLRCCRPARSAAFSTARRGGGSSTDSNCPSGKTVRLLWAWLCTRPSKSISGRSWKPGKTWRPPESCVSFGRPGWNRSRRRSSPWARVWETCAGRAKGWLPSTWTRWVPQGREPLREAWMDQNPQTEFPSGESQGDMRRLGERLVAKYMDEVAPKVEPAAVELDVQGEISGVSVRGRVDVLDVEGRLIDFKTASRRPSCVSPDYAFQLATYRQITPGASGEVRIDSLVKTQTVQIVQQSYTVEEPDIRATQVLYPMAQKAMGTGMYCPNRQSMLCSHKHCSFWKDCEQERSGERH